MSIIEVLESQKKFFNTKTTLSLDFRRNNLIKLKNSILSNQKDLYKAFKKDFNKQEFDVLITEVSLVMAELKFMLKNLNKLSKSRRVKTSITNFPSKGYIIPEPYGNVLIVSPWNYPFQLTMIPLIGAIGAGNTVVVKPSNYTPTVSKVIKNILSVFDENYVYVVLGGREQNQILFEQKYDFIFFTGGQNVGKLLLQKASQNLTPVILELGGRSPCIIDSDADINTSAKRLVWGKFLNAGQTCVAPNHCFVHESIKNALLEKLIFYVNKFYYENDKLKKDFPFIINEKHILRLQGLIDNDKVIFGGKVKKLLFEPTIMDNVNLYDKVLQEEIFGPILPLITYSDIDKVIDSINDMPKPLALYYFGNKNKKLVSKYCSFGGGCINDTIMHLTEENLPFGGVGESGMGAYHGKKTFEAFSHYKTLLVKKKLENTIKYPPKTKFKVKMIKNIFNIK